MSTVLRVAIQSVLGLAGLGALLFLPAGTLDYWQAWVFLAVFTVVSIIPTVHLLRKDPAIVERRMRAGPKAETRPVQKVVVAGIIIRKPERPVRTAPDVLRNTAVLDLQV